MQILKNIYEFTFEILSRKEQKLFKGFAIFGTLETNIIKLKKLLFIKSINYFFDNAPLLDFGGFPRFRTHTKSLRSSSNGV
ncbi:hypothetical protein BpHYR1_045018 [Brachionus plicatilis]|uniref:Uncharacterized protein n=1 Tax=Brachionus plicatilis TaxID=10195 RepID=A0A3M7RJE9_BRAPC|nr:hypothetical protein BpHYR1_045018 [Brachionus plicatilis]